MGSLIFYGEYRRQLKAVQIAIRTQEIPVFPENVKRELVQAVYRIEVRADCIMLFEHGRCWRFVLPKELRALPGTCSSLEWIQGPGIQGPGIQGPGIQGPGIQGPGIQLRLQLESDEEMNEENGDLILSALRDPSCEVLCSRCDAPIIQPAGGFTKVLPLPMGDWNDLTGDMWCCKSKVIAGERGKMDPLRLDPDEGSIMVDDLHLLVNSRMLTKGSVKIERRKGHTNQQRPAKSFNVLCQRCACILGSVSHSGGSGQLETTKLFRYGVHMKHKGDQRLNQLPDPLEYTIGSLMVSLFKSQMTFKFIIDDEDEHKPRLLLWVLGIDTRLLTGTCRTPSINQGKASSQEISIQLESYPVIKVLYQTCASQEGQRLSKEWDRDLMVHGITITMQACLQLGLLLATSTLQAPPTMRQMNGFVVGSLKLS